MNEHAEVRDLWSFMLEIYDRPNVGPICLDLQERYQLDVPLFLAVLYGAASGRKLDSEVIEVLDRDCSHWRETVIRPLRRIRTTMKSNSWLARNNQVHSLRESIKSDELQAEKIEVEVLESLIAELPVTEPCRTRKALTKIANLILHHYHPSYTDGRSEDICLIVDTYLRFFKLAEKGEAS